MRRVGACVLCDCEDGGDGGEVCVEQRGSCLGGNLGERGGEVGACGSVVSSLKSRGGIGGG